MMYLAAFISALLVDSIPIIAPPAWTILVVMIVKFELNPWIVVALGAVGSTIGRYLLSKNIHRFSKSFLGRREDDNIKYIGRRLDKRYWPSFFFVLVYSLTPLSTTALFTAAGMAKMRPWLLLPPFFIGKFASDAAMVFSGKYAAKSIPEIIHGQAPWQSIPLATAGLALIVGTVLIDWKTLLEHKKLRL